MVKEITKVEEFTQALTNTANNLVIIDFYGQWCPPCKIIAPKFEIMSQKYPTVGFYKIDINTPDGEKIATACEIKSLPTFCFFINGQYSTRIVGGDDVKLEALIQQNLVKKDYVQV